MYNPPLSIFAADLDMTFQLSDMDSTVQWGFILITTPCRQTLSCSGALRTGKALCYYWHGLHVISQERKMLWVYGVISHHIPPDHAHCPTQSHAHKFLIHSYPQSVPSCWFAGATVRPFFLDSSKYHCPQQVSWSEDDRLCESFPETAKIVSINTHVRKWFLFFYSVLLHCQSSDQPFIAACAVHRKSTPARRVPFHAVFAA